MRYRRIARRGETPCAGFRKYTHCGARPRKLLWTCGGSGAYAPIIVRDDRFRKFPELVLSRFAQGFRRCGTMALDDVVRYIPEALGEVGIIYQRIALGDLAIRPEFTRDPAD